MEQAIAMATETPRKAISLSCLSKGQTANLVRWRWDKENKKLSWSRYNGRSHSF
jgi:N-acetylglucosamine-6-phosphate deacetylase